MLYGNANIQLRSYDPMRSYVIREDQGSINHSLLFILIWEFCLNLFPVSKLAHCVWLVIFFPTVMVCLVNRSSFPNMFFNNYMLSVHILWTFMQIQIYAFCDKSKGKII